MRRSYFTSCIGLGKELTRFQLGKQTHPVTRVCNVHKDKNMNGVIHLDTLYLLIKYPHEDIFKRWYNIIKDADYQLLKLGFPVEKFLIRNGASCYKVSLWQHDARIYLTDQVDDKLGEGKGAGIWVQLGPKFLIHHITHLQRAVSELLADAGLIGEYTIKINRLDVAIDIFGVSMKDQDLNLWRYGWVGRSKVSSNFFNSRTGALETINIGSRGSSVYLRIYDKLAQAIQEGDIEYWLDIWKDNPSAVTRVEWELKPKQGGFPMDLQDFSLLNGFSIRELLKYLIDWGRLCIPNPEDSNNRRWQDAPFWTLARDLVNEFSEDDYPVSRYGKEFQGVSEAYIKFLSGTLSGGMARLGTDNPDIFELIQGLEKNGHPMQMIQRVAAKKAARISKL